MLNPGAKDERAALAFEDLASALDAGLPLETLGGNSALGDQVLTDLVSQRGVQLRATETIVLEAGWKSGNAVKVLRDQAANRSRRAEFRQQLWQSVRYPALLLCMLLLAALATYAVIGPGFLIALLTLYAVLGALAWTLARMVRRGDASLERIPILGPLFEDLRELPYLESLQALYGAGIPIVQAHEHAIRTVRMVALRERLGRVQSLLAQGETLREALDQAQALTSETRLLLTTGEQAGQLEDALQRALRRRQEIGSRKLQESAKMLGHVIYGLAVVSILIIAYLFYSAYFAMLRGIR